MGNKASFIQNLIFFIVVFLIITVSGCEDDAINEAKPKLGQIEGLLKPADAATEIQLVQAGNIVATTYPDENGKYIFSNLEFGGYDIIVIAEGYHVASEVNTITL
ncbi:TPA: carboxypeptidase regulatory-like domain-containing protein, partial [Candidatus Poribacteria bacterium]|nr:carboxypeptidase regulatory-like domain-containing protein [Candidatus Poribacteria bacterium]